MQNNKYMHWFNSANGLNLYMRITRLFHQGKRTIQCGLRCVSFDHMWFKAYHMVPKKE